MNYFLFIFLLFILSCNSNKNTRDSNKDILDKNKLTLILKDIQIAEARTKLSKIHRDSLIYLNAIQYQAIFKKHKIQGDDFIESYGYYLQDPKELNEIYESILDKLIKEEADQITNNQ